MRPTEAFASATPDEIKAALAGGKIVLYATGRPPSADHAITRSTPLASFVFAAPAFGEDGSAPLFVEAVVKATSTGTPGFARAFNAEGAVVADFSAGWAGEVKLAETLATVDYPVKIVSIVVPPTAEKIEWAKTEAGHVFVTNSDNPYRKLSVHG